MKALFKNHLSYDDIGMASSTLCFIHCIATPFIFIAQACSMSCCKDSPLWWKSLDFLFLVISFIAVYFAGKTTTKSWVKIGLYVLFSSFALLTINHHIDWVSLPMQINYTLAAMLFTLHLYNKKQSPCCENTCSKGEGFD